jgi:hypothetical protein
VKDEALATETEEMLEELECCLAEAVVTSEEEDLKAKARAEWDANEAARPFSTQEERDAYWFNREQWLQKYQHVVKTRVSCCGAVVPDWSDEE